MACSGAEDDATHLHRTLAETVGTEAPLDSRLAGFVYEPSEPGRDDSLEAFGQRVRDAVRGLGGGLIGRLRARGGAEDLHVLGLAGVLGNAQQPTDSSIATLRRAAEAAPASAAPASDLAAFLLQRGTASEQPDDLVEALEAAQRATDLDPHLPEARYNLALALDRLVLWHRAREVYEGYLELDPDSGWAHRARTRIAELDGLLSADPDAVRRRIGDAARAGDSDGLRDLVSRAPGPALELGLGELLPRWAEAELDGSTETARPEAEAVRALGEAVAGLSGDSLLLDALAASRSPAELHGVVAWGRAAPRLVRREYQEAAADLAATRRAFRATGHPLLLEADYYQAVADYQTGRYRAAFDALLSIAQRAPADRYPCLLRKVYRMQGTIQHVWGNLETARTHYRRAIQQGEACHDPEAVANDEMPLATVAWNLDEPDAAAVWWRALQKRPAVWRADYRYLLAAIPADLLAIAGHREAALWFRREALAIALETDDPIVRAEGYLKLAEAQVGLEAPAAAIEAIERAEPEIARIADAAARTFEDTETLRLRAAALAGSDPATATAALAKVEQRIRDSGSAGDLGYLRILPRVLLAHARLLDRQGRHAEAESLLRDAAHEIRRQALTISDVEERLAFVGEAQPIYDALTWIAWDQGRYDEALATYDAVRSLRRWWGPGASSEMKTAELGSEATSISAEGAVAVPWRSMAAPAVEDGLNGSVRPAQILGEPIGSAFSEASALLAYGFRDDATVVWWTIGGPVESRKLAVTRTQLETLIKRAETAWVQHRTQELEQRLEDLYRELVQPIEPKLGKDTALRVVLYESYSRIPFSALINGEGKYLFESRDVVLALWLSQPGDRAERERPLPDTPEILAVGDPAFDPIRFADLQRLPGARQEAREAFEIFEKRGVLLEGQDATPDQIASLLPQFPIVHIAAHGLIDSARPLRSSLVLAAQPTATSPAERESKARDRLTARNILDLDLSRVHLILLSSCQTARTGTSRGGVGIGTVPALLASGAQSVIASPWPQADAGFKALLPGINGRHSTDESPFSVLRITKLQSSNDHLRDPWAVGVAYEVYGSLP